VPNAPAGLARGIVCAAGAQNHGHLASLWRTTGCVAILAAFTAPDGFGRLLALGILHRYSNLSWWMQRLPEPERPTLDALADCWFATS